MASYTAAAEAPTTKNPRGESSATSSNPTTTSTPTNASNTLPQYPTNTYSATLATLREVELSATAPGGGVTAFNPAHTRALEELRKAQIALAQAWGRGEADDEEAGTLDGKPDVKRDGKGGKSRDGVTEGSGMGMGLAAEERERGQLKSGSVLEDDGADGKGHKKGDSGDAKAKAGERSQLEEETENDILLARRRRAANDKYFERVREGVVDVVGKLEAVAARMRDVEGETGSLWDKDSENSESNSSSG